MRPVDSPVPEAVTLGVLEKSRLVGGSLRDLVGVAMTEPTAARADKMVVVFIFVYMFGKRESRRLSEMSEILGQIELLGRVVK
jgi:hypothetical protein